MSEINLKITVRMNAPVRISHSASETSASPSGLRFGGLTSLILLRVVESGGLDFLRPSTKLLCSASFELSCSPFWRSVDEKKADDVLEKEVHLD